jgi:putative tricarboxylic transport membrane protein
MRIPGTPASAAYVDDAYQLTRQGQPERGLGMCMAAAATGGIIGTIVLVAAAPSLARFAINFSNAEYFWLACLGLTCAAFVSTGSPVKGAASLLIGLFISTIGIDVMAGHPRFTFGTLELMGGVSFIPALIGMFAVTEVLQNVVDLKPLPDLGRPSMGRVFRGLGREWWHYRRNVFRGGFTGTVIGALPGAGADIAAWVAYAVSRRFSKQPERFGKGHVEGVAEAGAANNGALSGAWVPTLVFGIPGDSITAIVIGVLYLKGLEPGPTIFIKQPQLVYAVFLAFFLANLMLIPLGALVIRYSTTVLRVPQPILMPAILMFCIVGSFAINNTPFDVGVMLVLGLAGYLLGANGYPLAPLILGIVLGNMVEFNFMTTMLKSKGDPTAFFSRPISATIGVAVIAIWVVPIIRHAWRRGRSER